MAGAIPPGYPDTYVADAGNRVIRRIDSLGVIRTVAGKAGGLAFTGDGGLATNATLGEVSALAVDQRSGDLFFTVAGNRVAKLDTRTGLLRVVAGGGTVYRPLAGYREGLGTIASLTIDRQNRPLWSERSKSQVLRLEAPGAVKKNATCYSPSMLGRATVSSLERGFLATYQLITSIRLWPSCLETILAASVS